MTSENNELFMKRFSEKYKNLPWVIEMNKKINDETKWFMDLAINANDEKKWFLEMITTGEGVEKLMEQNGNGITRRDILIEYLTTGTYTNSTDDNWLNQIFDNEKFKSFVLGHSKDIIETKDRATLGVATIYYYAFRLYWLINLLILLDNNYIPTFTFKTYIPQFL